MNTNRELHADNKGPVILVNIGNYSPIGTVLHSRRPESSDYPSYLSPG